MHCGKNTTTASAFLTPLCGDRGQVRMLAVAVTLALSWQTYPTFAVEFFDYGFTSVDNSSGGSVLDSYVSQQFWADSDLLLLGAQLRIELDQGSIFQDSVEGSDFSFGAPHEVLVEQQPSLAFDTHVGLNGARPGVVAGGAVNLGGEGEVRFDSSGINAAWAPGPTNLESGRFDLGMITLSGDAAGRGAILLSGAEAQRRGGGEVFAHVFEIADGVIHFANPPIPSWDGTHVSLDRNFEPLGPPEREPPAPPRGNPMPMDPSVLDPPPALPPVAPEVPDDPIVIIYRPQEGEGAGEPIDIVHPIEPVPGDSPIHEILAPYLPFVELEGAPLIVQSDGAGGASIRMADLSDDAVNSLVASGDWSPNGANLVFTGEMPGAVPEADSALLALLIAASALLQAFRK